MLSLKLPRIFKNFPHATAIIFYRPALKKQARLPEGGPEIGRDLAKIAHPAQRCGAQKAVDFERYLRRSGRFHPVS
jgi:hypothetical protein